MEIKIDDDNWTAWIIMSPVQDVPPANFLHLQAKIQGKTQEDAKAGAQAVLDLFAKGRETFIRAYPEADTDRDFDTKEVYHHGYVRFSFKLESGRWNDVDPPMSNELCSLGALSDDQAQNQRTAK